MTSHAYLAQTFAMTELERPDSDAATPSPEALAADLAAMLRTGVTVERCRSATALLALELVRVKAASDAIDDRAVSASNLIREACATVDGIATGATTLLLGLAPGSRGRLLKDRRRDAADLLGYSAEHLRKDREPLLLEAVADELYAMDSAYRLRHRHRTEAEREPPNSRLRIDWLAQHRSYRRVWTPIVAMRNDLLVLVNYLHGIKAEGQVPKPPGQIEDGSDEQPVDFDTWAACGCWPTPRARFRRPTPCTASSSTCRSAKPTCRGRERCWPPRRTKSSTTTSTVS
jgi:hypothetical protein